MATKPRKTPNRTAPDSILVVTHEPAVAETKNDGAQPTHFHDTFFVVRRHTIHPISKKLHTKDVAQFFTRAGLDSWLVQQGDGEPVQFRIAGFDVKGVAVGATLGD